MKRTSVAAVVALLLGTGASSAWAGGATSPSSPAGNEYAIPLSNAAPPKVHHHHAVTAVATYTATTPAASIHRHHHRRHHTLHKRARTPDHHRKTLIVVASRRPPGTAPAASELDSSGGNVWLWTGGIAGSVLILGGAAGLLARRFPSA